MLGFCTDSANSRSSLLQGNPSAVPCPGPGYAGLSAGRLGWQAHPETVCTALSFSEPWPLQLGCGLGCTHISTRFLSAALNTGAQLVAGAAALRGATPSSTEPFLTQRHELVVKQGN